jgi:hypothetical protein
MKISLTEVNRLPEKPKLFPTLTAASSVNPSFKENASLTIASGLFLDTSSISIPPSLLAIIKNCLPEASKAIEQ